MALTPINPNDIDRIIREGFPTFDETFTERVMARLNIISPLIQSSNPPAQITDNGKRKYAVLAKIIDADRSTNPIPYSMEVTIISSREMESVQKLLLDENLLEYVAQNRLRITDGGRRFMEAMEQAARK